MHGPLVLEFLPAELAGAQLWAFFVGVAALGGLALYFGFAALLYRRYYVRRRDQAAAWKLQPKRWLQPALHRWGASVAAANMALGGLISGTYAYYISQGGYTALYFDAGARGWDFTIVSTLLAFVLMEGALYHNHRFLHRPWVFRKIHRWHHRCVAPTPFTTMTMHPLEFLSFQAITFLPTFFFPIWAPAFVFILLYMLSTTMMDHSGVALRHPLPWHVSSRYHDDHHLHFHCNYGQILVFFDRFYGTLRRHDRRYGEEVFGGRGEAIDGVEAGDFYDYS